MIDCLRMHITTKNKWISPFLGPYMRIPLTLLKESVVLQMRITWGRFFCCYWRGRSPFKSVSLKFRKVTCKQVLTYMIVYPLLLFLFFCEKLSLNETKPPQSESKKKYLNNLNITMYQQVVKDWKSWFSIWKLLWQRIKWNINSFIPLPWVYSVQPLLCI